MENKRLILKVWGKMVLLAIVAGALLRVALAFHPLTVASSIPFLHWIEIFVLGALNDLCVTSVLFLPLWLYLMTFGNWPLKAPQRWYALALLVGLWCWVRFGCQTLHEFNGGLADVLGWVVVFWIASFALRSFVPKVRPAWKRAWTAFFIFIYVFILVLNVCGEWLFWDEFGVRYNFIAVDYLVYTTEVVGNIIESYPVGWIMAAVILFVSLLVYGLFRHEIKASAGLTQSVGREKALLVWIPVIASIAVLPLSERLHSSHTWSSKLQANGAYCFVQAFLKNHLDYKEFYTTLEDQVVAEEMQTILSIQADTTVHQPVYPNIVLITMESMSADYMSRFGNKQNLTPALDSLWNRSMAFEQMYAAGNRTVRGLEALTLSRPPAPGESIIKRPDAKVYPAISDNLQRMGYTCAFYYGGDSYFDNMEPFFSRLGYQIKDRKTMSKEQITCQTVWGVCDGDVYNRLIEDLDSAYAHGDRIYAHMLTTSNHRPYIYPDGYVSIPPSEKSRLGAVMYSDYALGQFFIEAAKHPWFDHTVFVVVADHCASSAGSTELPLENYHIPALIHAPARFAPQIVPHAVSQIDLMPTLFALLDWPADPNLYGRDVLSPEYQSRAFLATYQDMGYFSNGILTVLSPSRRVKQFVLEPTEENPYATRQIEATDSAAVHQAVLFYQHSNS